MPLQPSLQDCEALPSYIELSDQFYQKLLGYKSEQTSLQEIPKSEWNKFARQKGLNQNSLGVYFPRNQTAIVQKGNPLVLFHEYFGHGLFCEQTLSGLRLVDLERRLLEEERQEFSGREFKLEDIKKFRQQNRTFQDLDTFRRQNLAKYELFAIWTEYLLSKEFGLTSEFEQRYDSLPIEEREVVDPTISFSENYGNLATFYSFGLRKIQDKKRLLRLSQDIFGKKLSRTPLILHFGSKKPFSDIDLFLVSDDINPLYSEWIDVRTAELQDVQRRISLLDPKLTDPLMVGKLVLGNENYLEEIRLRIFAQSITEEAINFNLQMWNYHQIKSRDPSLNRHFQDKNLRSSKTYLTNALALKNGDKVLTFNGLVRYSHVLSRSEKFIELKGGIE